MKYSAIQFIFILFSISIVAQEKNNFEDWKNKPKQVISNNFKTPPSDAKSLFDGALQQWKYSDNQKAKWNVTKDFFTVTPGEPDIFTKQKFGSCQLHVEWQVPTNETHDNLNWGNSGIYFMGLYEIQIYDSYMDKHEIYYNGQAGSIYKQHCPLVNVSKPAGEWQSFDIIFTAPVFNKDHTLKSPAYFTVFHNGVLIQNNAKLIGPTTHGNFTEYSFHEQKLPLMIQSHGSEVSYRNIWIRDI